MTRSWSIFLPGRVPTKGSYRAGKRGTVRSDCSWLNEWTGWACAEVLASDPPTWDRHQPVSVQMQIAINRPDAHFTKSGKLNATGRKYPAPTRQEDGDWDKHERAVFDMLVMAGVLADDADVIGPGPCSRMFWADEWEPGIRIVIRDDIRWKNRPVHAVSAHPDKDRGILCDRDYGVDEHVDQTIAATTASRLAHEVTCAKCRDMLGMSKGVR